MPPTIRPDVHPAAAGWLLDPAFPTVRRLARERLRLEAPGGIGGGVDPGSPPLRAEPWIATLLEVRTKAGRDGTRVPVHAYQKWGGAHWRLLSLAEVADERLSRDEVAGARIAAALDRVAGWLDGPGRRTRWVPIAGRVRMCGSQEGAASLAAISLGHGSEPRVERWLERLLEWQWPDGGWNCDRRPEVTHASFNESWLPLRALAAYAARGPRRDLAQQAATGAGLAGEFLLRHRVDRSHRTGELAHPSLARLRWPSYWHYDRLAGLRALADAGRLDDPRTRDALEDLRAARRPDGTWRPDGRHWTTPARPDRAGSEVVDWTMEGERRMLTLRCLEVLGAA